MSEEKKSIEDYDGFGKAVKKVNVKTEEMEIVHPKPFDPIADFSPILLRWYPLNPLAASTA